MRVHAERVLKAACGEGEAGGVREGEVGVARREKFWEDSLLLHGGGVGLGRERHGLHMKGNRGDGKARRGDDDLRVCPLRRLLLLLMWGL